MSATQPRTREHWVFLGRENWYGYDYLVWELRANPRPGHFIGKRKARPV